MKYEATIRDQLAAYLSGRSMSINQFSEQSGINSGTLSRIINGHQPIAMSHLERLTRGMGMPEDHFYSLYVDECLYYSAPTWRRLRPFLLRCADFDRLDCIKRIVEILLDNLIYAPMLFEVAEELFGQGKRKAAALLYENVSASEKYQYSERLAVCQYRLFVIALGKDQNTDLRAATLFESYVPRLDELDQLDALKDLAHVFSSLHQWARVDELAKELHRIASIQYELYCQSERKHKIHKQPSKPIFGYILYSYLLQSVVCGEAGDYRGALSFVAKYGNAGWVKERSEEAVRTLRQFQDWAQANTYLYRLMDGQQDALAEYLNYISGREDGVFTALSNIVEAANRYQWNIDHILEQYSEHFPYQAYSAAFGGYNQQITLDQHAQFLGELAVYHLSREHCGGMDYLLCSIDFSAKINSGTNIIRCVDVFEQYRNRASREDIRRYQLLISEVRKLNEKRREIAPSCV